VFRLIVGEGLKLAVIGVVLGLIGALLVTRVLMSQLFGVTSMDPFSFTITAVILLAVALIACFVPARMANKVDPMVVLRYE
jgi:putative ABC transport system permease protein